MAEIKVTPPRFVVVIHNVRSALNVGSIFRTADAAGVGKIYVCGYSPTPKHDKVRKTALGAEESVPWECHRQTWRLLERLKQEGYRIVALEQTKGSENVFTFRPRFPVALVVGNEVRGLSRPILDRADAVIEIPMRGAKESLNVAVAFGIAAYQLFNG
jgi:23S rRNA (guanosine2251-2'-O)-methyltransferase